MIRLSTLVLLLFVCIGEASPLLLLGRPRQAAAAGGGATYLVKQDFEGTGYDNSETWSEAAGDPNEDYTGTVLAGSQSLLLDGTSATQRTDSPTFASTADAWVYMLIRVTDLPSSTENFITLISTGPVGLFSADITSGGNLRVSGSVNSATTVSAMSVDTTYHVWIHYVAGSGVNAVCSVAFSTDGVRPTTGNNFTSVSNGSETASLNFVRLRADTGVTFICIQDKIRVDDALIGDNPP